MLVLTRIFLIMVLVLYPATLKAMHGKPPKILQLLLQKEDIQGPQLWGLLEAVRADASEYNKTTSNHKKYGKRRLEKGKSVEIIPLPEENFGSYLHLAVLKNAPAVEIIINSMDFNELLKVDGDGNTSLHLAIINGRKDSVDKIFKGPLSLTAQNEYFSILQQSFLITNCFGRNPLHEIIYYALNKGPEAEEWAIKVVALLIDNGLHPGLRETNDSAASPLEIALHNGLKKIAILLAINGAKLPSPCSEKHKELVANLKSFQDEVYEKSREYIEYLYLIKSNEMIEEDLKKMIKQSRKLYQPNCTQWELKEI